MSSNYAGRTDRIDKSAKSARSAKPYRRSAASSQTSGQTSQAASQQLNAVDQSTLRPGDYIETPSVSGRISATGRIQISVDDTSDTTLSSARPSSRKARSKNNTPYTGQTGSFSAPAKKSIRSSTPGGSSKRLSASSRETKTAHSKNKERSAKPSATGKFKKVDPTKNPSPVSMANFQSTLFGGSAKNATSKGSSRTRSKSEQTSAVKTWVPMIAIMAAIAAIAIVLVAVFGNTPLSTLVPRIGQSSQASAPSSSSSDLNYQPNVTNRSFDYNNLVAGNNGRFTYSENGQVISRTGIDIAEHQGDIDWAKVKADGISLAIIRLGYRGTTDGKLYLDSMYKKNVAEALAAGLDVGVYFNSQATNENEAREEAQFVLSNLPDTKLDFPIAYDQEPSDNKDGDRAYNLGARQYTANALAFCATIDKAGYIPMVYGNQYDIGDMSIDDLETYDIWYAEYYTPHPTCNFKYMMWQYSAQGSVDGIDGNVDMDIYLDYPDNLS